MSGVVDYIRNSRIFQLGLAGMLIGGGLMAYGKFSELPKRSELTVTEGIVTKAEKITHTSKKRGNITSVKFKLHVTTKDGVPPIELLIPSDEITQEKVVAVIKERIKAEHDIDLDVYALSSGGTELMNYDSAIRKRSVSLENFAHIGRVVLGLGIPLALLGFFLGRRKTRRLAQA